MKRIKMVSGIILVSQLLLAIQLNGQTIPKKIVTLPAQQFKTVDYFNQSTTGETVSVYSLNTKVASFGMEPKTETQFGLEWKGKRIPLPAYERYFGNSKEIVFTDHTEFSGDESKAAYINSYQLKNGTLQKRGSLTLESPYYNSFPLGDTGNLLVTDEMDGSGSEISIYNADFKRLTHLRPFGQSLFNHKLLDVKGDKLAFLFFLPDNQSYKLIKINTLTGNIDYEVQFPVEGYNISRINLIGDHILLTRHKVPQNQELVSIGKNGKVLWQKNKYFLLMKGVRNGDKWQAIAVDYDNYSSFDPETGATNWQKPLASLLPALKPGEKIALDMTPVDDATQVAMLFYRHSSSKDTHNQEYVLVNNLGKVRHETISSKSSYLSIKAVGKKVLLLNRSTDQILKEYEKSTF